MSFFQSTESTYTALMPMLSGLDSMDPKDSENRQVFNSYPIGFFSQPTIK